MSCTLLTTVACLSYCCTSFCFKQEKLLITFSCVLVHILQISNLLPSINNLARKKCETILENAYNCLDTEPK